MAIRNFIFPVGFIILGIVLLFTKHGRVIVGTQINAGWLVLGLGAVSLLKSLLAPRRAAPAGPSPAPDGKDPGAKPPAPPPGASAS